MLNPATNLLPRMPDEIVFPVSFPKIATIDEIIAYLETMVGKQEINRQYLSNRRQMKQRLKKLEPLVDRDILMEHIHRHLARLLNVVLEAQRDFSLRKYNPEQGENPSSS